MTTIRRLPQDNQNPSGDEAAANPTKAVVINVVDRTKGEEAAIGSRTRDYQARRET